MCRAHVRGGRGGCDAGGALWQRWRCLAANYTVRCWHRQAPTAPNAEVTAIHAGAGLVLATTCFTHLVHTAAALFFCGRCRGGVPIVPLATRENCREAVAKISRQRRVKISWQRINFSAVESAAEERERPSGGPHHSYCSTCHSHLVVGGCEDTIAPFPQIGCKLFSSACRSWKWSGTLCLWFSDDGGSEKKKCQPSKISKSRSAQCSKNQRNIPSINMKNLHVISLINTNSRSLR